MEIAEFALSIIAELLAGVIQSGVDLSITPYFQRRRIQRRVDDATAEVVEPLLPFLSQEGIPEDRQRRLLQTCADELRPLTYQPEALFQGSLNGQKIFDDLYADRELPQTVIEDGLKDTYALLCPRIATLLCKIPAAVKDWESEAWSENYRRLDEISQQMRTLFTKVDQLAAESSRDEDETLNTVRRSLAQKIGFELDLTGLRADRPLAGRFDDFFVHPELTETIDNGRKREPLKLESSSETFQQFVTTRVPGVVTASAGGGKSTWAKWLQRQALSSEWTGLGIRVELRRFTEIKLPSLYELIRESAGRHLSEELNAERIKRWLERKQVIFILDGFDEIRPTERDSVYEWILELVTAARGCSFVITSRPLTTNHLERFGRPWKRWTMEPFDKPRIIEYIGRWYAHTPLLTDADRNIDINTLAESWSKDPTVGPLTGNPLLLSTVLMVHHLDGSLPSGRSQLYQRYVEGMLGLWDDRRQVSATMVPLTLQQKRTILRAFALHMFLQAEDQLDEDKTLNWMTEFLHQQSISLSAEDVLSNLRERSGLIIGPGVYSFAHKSIAEYFVAETILQGDQQDNVGARMDRFRLFESRNDDRWNTVTFLWAGLAPIVDLEAFIEACFEVQACALGFGVLFDQFERISRDTRRRVILSFDEEQCGVARARLGPRHSWVVSHPEQLTDDLKFQSFELRQLTPNKGFHSLVERAVAEKALTASDVFDARGTLRELMWMTMVTTPNSIDDWQALLEMKPPGDESQLVIWTFWIGERAILAISLGDTNVELSDAIRTFEKCLPKYSGLIPLMVMSALIILVSDKYRLFNTQDRSNEVLTELVTILPRLGDVRGFPDWLVGTKRWDLAFGNIGIVDLLTSFIECTNHLINNGRLEQEPTAKAVSFVEELLVKRDGLQNQLELELT